MLHLPLIDLKVYQLHAKYKNSKTSPMAQLQWSEAYELICFHVYPGIKMTETETKPAPHHTHII